MLSEETLEALATVHLHPQTQSGGEIDLMPLLRAVEAAAAAMERERCAKLCEDEAKLCRGKQGVSDFRLCAARIRHGS